MTSLLGIFKIFLICFVASFIKLLLLVPSLCKELGFPGNSNDTLQNVSSTSLLTGVVAE